MTASSAVHRVDDGLGSSIAGGFTTVPGYLIGKLALDQSQQGKGLGVQLLLNALECALGAAEVGGGRVVVVDALDDEAAAFYLKFGFIEVKGRPGRLIMKMATVRKTLGVS